MSDTLAHVDRVFAEGQLSAEFDAYNKTEFGCVFYNAGWMLNYPPRYMAYFMMSITMSHGRSEYPSGVKSYEI